MVKVKWLIVWSFIAAAFCGCKRDDVVIPQAQSGYPSKVGRLILTQCAVSGCHNNKSKEAAAGLSMESWEKLFEGGRSGACIIPYRPDFSTFCYYTNTDPSLGITLNPVMPYQREPLSETDYLMLRDWIAQGAPNGCGMVKFGGNPTRKKFYVTNQGCDVVTVFDQETGLQMRYIDVGNDASTESPHYIRVAPDGQHWYALLRSGKALQKFRTADDSYAGQVFLNAGDWNTFVITPDSKNAFCIDWTGSKIKYVDLVTGAVLITYVDAQNLIFPHGSAISGDGKTLYVTAQTGNYIYKIDVSDPYSPQIDTKVLQTGQSIIKTPLYDAHEILLSPDGSKYFVSCQKTNEVRIMKTANDSLLATIPVGSFPQEIAVSASTGKLFVTCPEDTVTFAGKRGSVAVIDYNTHLLVKIIDCGYQPHGLAVDESKKLVYIANRNFNPSGPAPHHSSGCGGRNGNIVFIDLITLSLTGKKIEVASDPYSVALKP